MTHKASTLEQITPRAAADKEMSLLCGYASDTHGSMICGDVYTWCRFAVAVGGAGWEEQLEEENLCIILGHLPCRVVRSAGCSRCRINGPEKGV